MARQLQLRKPSTTTHPMPHKVTIHVQVNDAKPIRPLRSFSLMLLELRTRLGLDKSGKFRSSLSRSNLHEVAPRSSKRVRG
jgi:hypothetical protein